MRGLSLLAAVLSFCATAALAADGWQRSGLELIPRVEIVPIIDIERIKRQQSIGCSETSIKFGDAAPMRGWMPSQPWPEDVRRLLAAAEMTDNPRAAYDRYRRALDAADLSSAQHAAIIGQWNLAALQFGDIATAREIGSRSLPDPQLPELRADRLLWRSISRAAAGRAADWEEIDADLAEAFELDHQNFNVRAWRLISWLMRRSKAGSSSSSCTDALKELQTRALSVSEASPCPLMLGHFDHALSVQLQSRPEAGLQQAVGKWHAFAAAILSEVARNHQRTDALARAVAERASSGSCRLLMTDELRRLRDSRP